jgi:hypothetical protein
MKMRKAFAVAILFLLSGLTLHAQNSNSVTVTVVPPPTWTISVSPGSYYQNKATVLTITVTAGTVVNSCTATWDSTALPLTFPTPIPANPVTLTAAVSATMTSTLGNHSVFITCPVPQLSLNAPVALPNGKVGISYSTNLGLLAQVRGGVPPYSYSLDPATPLPTGLSLSSTGVVTGTPSGAGSFSFNFTVKDSSALARILNVKTKVAS